MDEPEVRERIAHGEGRRRAPPALGDLRHPRARIRLGARRRQDRPGPRRRRRRGDQRAPRRVSHNYKRNHAFNLWYTIAVPPGDVLEEHVDVLHRDSGALVTRVLPTLKLYKIGVKLDMTGKTAADAKAEVLAHEQPERRDDMAAPELSRPRGRDDPRRPGGPPARRASVRRAGRDDRLHRGRRARRARSRSRSASSCAASPR